jgi:hypothetical protein
LTAYEGKTLEELYRDALMYAEREFERDGYVAAVAAPFVTALLAGEALKAAAVSPTDSVASDPDHRPASATTSRYPARRPTDTSAVCPAGPTGAACAIRPLPPDPPRAVRTAGAVKQAPPPEDARDLN